MSLSRKKGLSSDPAKAKAWRERSAAKAKENAAAKPRKPLSRSSGLDRGPRTPTGSAGPEKRRDAATRRAPLRSKPRREAPEESAERAAAGAAFFEAVCGPLAACLWCGGTDDLDSHHAVPKQTLKRIAKSRRLTGAAFWRIVYAPEVGIPLCSAWSKNRCHERLTNRTLEIPLDRLPDRVLRAAADLGPEAVTSLERTHPPAGKSRV